MKLYCRAVKLYYLKSCCPCQSVFLNSSRLHLVIALLTSIPSCLPWPALLYPLLPHFIPPPTTVNCVICFMHLPNSPLYHVFLAQIQTLRLLYLLSPKINIFAVSTTQAKFNYYGKLTSVYFNTVLREMLWEAKSDINDN